MVDRYNECGEFPDMELALDGEWVEYSNYQQLEAKVQPLVDALELIKGHEGLTLLMDEPIEAEQAHQVGANKAFNECAKIAKQALAKLEVNNG